LADSLREVIEAAERIVCGGACCVIALDGGSGAGKSTIAASLADGLDAVIVPQDDFYAANVPDRDWAARSPAECARDVIDWRRLRHDALEPLREGRSARWQLIDFAAGARSDGTFAMSDRFAERAPSRTIVLDGAYSASPAIADLVDLTVLVDVPIDERHRRLDAREAADFLRAWHARWDPVERYYFTRIRPAASFDFVLRG
jgi:para-aminobenzoate synthetase